MEMSKEDLSKALEVLVEASKKATENIIKLDEAFKAVSKAANSMVFNKIQEKVSEVPVNEKEEFEKGVIKQIKMMRKKKFTYRDISAHLNNIGCPTFSGKGSWHAQSIHRIFTDRR